MKTGKRTMRKMRKKDEMIQAMRVCLDDLTNPLIDYEEMHFKRGILAALRWALGYSDRIENRRKKE
ncbi:MAG: hypothetical protein ACXQT3_02915 [Methermicoccaceae archaeon]